MGAFRGSAVKIPSISFQIWSSVEASPTATRAAVRSEYLNYCQPILWDQGRRICGTLPSSNIA